MNRIKSITLLLLMLALSFASCAKEKAIHPILSSSNQDESEMIKAMEKVLNNTEVPDCANINKGLTFTTSTQIEIFNPLVDRAVVNYFVDNHCTFRI